MTADAVFLFLCDAPVDELFAELEPRGGERLNLLLEGLRAPVHRETAAVARVRSYQGGVAGQGSHPDLAAKLRRLGFERMEMRPSQPLPAPRMRAPPERPHLERDRALGDWRLHLLWFLPGDRKAFARLTERLAGIATRPLTYFRSHDGWEICDLEREPATLQLDAWAELTPDASDLGRYVLHDAPPDRFPRRPS